MKTEMKAFLALSVVCVLWGTTYLMIKIGVETIPPYFFCAIRQLSAGLVLWLIVPFLRKKFNLSLSDVIKQVIPGILMIVMGNAVIAWAEKYIPSGLAALIVSAMPLYVTLLNFLIGKEKSINTQILLGLLLGCFGIVLIFKDNLADLTNTNYLTGIIASFVASFCWAAGTVYMKVNTFRTDSFINSAIQFTSSGIVLFIFSFFVEDYGNLNMVSSGSIWALVYLVFFGSILPYMCYLYAIKNMKVELVSVYAYINPFIAILLGTFILDEKLTWITAFAFLATVGGVYCINRGHAKSGKGAEKEKHTPATAPQIAKPVIDKRF
ncbi:MAG TPA: EamA family transporter [Bacteroidia bacterium]|nr:EamA family transporter [Bacteroidia bacterium]